MAQLPNYDDAARTLQGLSDGYEPSYIHGMICAHLCANQIFSGQLWLTEQMQLSQGVRLLHADGSDNWLKFCQTLLSDLSAVSDEQLSNNDFDFQLLLPDDAIDIEERAAALTDWCEGFCDTLETMGIMISAYSEEAQEALTYLEQVIEMDLEELEDNEAEEHALMEITEYIRMAVILIYMETQGMTGGSSSQIH